MSKVDLLDGFYRLWLRPKITHCIAVLFPSSKNESPLVGILLTNPMGWVSLPPNFSACTETVADMTNDNLSDNNNINYARNTPHLLDVLSKTPPVVETGLSVTSTELVSTQKVIKSAVTSVPSTDLVSPGLKLVRPSEISDIMVCPVFLRSPTVTDNTVVKRISNIKPLTMAAPTGTDTTNPFHTPLKYWDIYANDFCGLVQGNKWQHGVVKRILFQALDKVFRPLDKDDSIFRQETASIKKLKKGNVCWTTSKINLGWLLDTINRTISLPKHRGDRLLEILNSIPSSQRSIATKE